MGKNNTFKDIADKMWPRTKKELEKVIDNAKKMLGKGEDYLKDLSEKSVNQTKKISLVLQKEKLYYDLGKTLTKVPATRWKKHTKIGSLLKELKKLDAEIRKIK